MFWHHIHLNGIALQWRITNQKNTINTTCKTEELAASLTVALIFISNLLLFKFYRVLMQQYQLTTCGQHLNHKYQYIGEFQ